MKKTNLKLNKSSASIIKGGFSQQEAKRQMAIKRVNGTLTVLLLIALFITGLNYYFATSSEMVLNNLNREIVITNDENFDLQYKLDKMKSFTNVGNQVESSQLLKKAEEVIEIPFVQTSVPKVIKNEKTVKQAWNLGY
ncbi:hypothetical protein IJ732_04610 [bacterium]|nr:hypothetical protein [bacterium]